MNENMESNSSPMKRGRTARSIVVGLLIFGLAIAPAPSANATTTYEVPSTGLSFDADKTFEADPCSAGYGNDAVWADDDEINALIAGDSVTYLDIAEINGQPIDAEVTLTSISGMDQQDVRAGETALDRLDKCYDDPSTTPAVETDPDGGLVEISFDSETLTPGDAYFVLTIDFLANGNPVTLTNLKMNVEDIDNNQYLEVDNFSSALLAAGRDADNVQEYENGDTISVGSGEFSSRLSIPATARRFHALGSEDDNGAAETDKHVVEVSYASVSSLVLRLGVYEDGGGSFDLNFKGFTFTAPTETITAAPVVTPSATPAAAPAATLATTGVSDPLAIGILGSTAAILIGLGAFLSRMRRKLS
jgi:hypothetical protein